MKEKKRSREREGAIGVSRLDSWWKAHVCARVVDMNSDMSFRLKPPSALSPPEKFSGAGKENPFLCALFCCPPCAGEKREKREWFWNEFAVAHAQLGGLLDHPTTHTHTHVYTWREKKKRNTVNVSAINSSCVQWEIFQNIFRVCGNAGGRDGKGGRRSRDGASGGR